MRRPGAIGTMAVLILACIFGAAMLLSMASGAYAYRTAAETAADGAAGRSGTAYISMKLRQADTAGAVDVRPYGDGDGIFFASEYGGIRYETAVYCYGGYLMELFYEAGYDPGPESGESIIPAAGLDVDEPVPGLFRISLSDSDGTARTAYAYLRSGG